MMKGLKATLVCGLLVCAMIGVSMVAIGGRPPPTPPPTGTVYFSYADMGLKGYSLWKMNAADGSGKARVGAERCLYADGTGSNLGQLSWFPHGGHYWLLRFCQAEGTFPDGDDRHDLFAVRDDGAITVQLTDGLDLEIGGFSYGTQGAWGHSDQFASWFASKWIQDPVTYEWLETEPGLYRVGITYGTNGNPEPITEYPTLVLPTFLEDIGPSYGLRVKSYHYDWSPDGTQIVVAFNPSWPSCPGLCVVDIETLDELYLTGGNFPSWSPDGAKIAYRCASDNICIINPDGTGYKQVLAIKDTETSWCGAGDSLLDWSSDSKHLAYQLYCYLPHQGVFRTWIYRVAIDGTQNTNLTKDLPVDLGKWPVGWR